MGLTEILKFDESMVFDNRNQTNGKAANVLVDQASEQFVETIMAQIEHLRGEIALLRNLVNANN